MPDTFNNDLKAIFRNARDHFGKAVHFGIPVLYFFMWNKKKDTQSLIRPVALCVLSFSALVYGLELAAELLGREVLATNLEKFTSKTPIMIVAVFVAVVFLVWHAYEEARKPDYESLFVRGMHSLTELKQSRDKDSLKKALELFHSMFVRTGVAHVSVYTKNIGEPSISRTYVYPDEHEPPYFESLSIDPPQGVAGNAFADLKTRYVPQLRLFGSPFPHAVAMAHSGQNGTGSWEQELHVDQVKMPKGHVPYLSFLSIPLRLRGADKCVGVLSFDFKKKDPLDRDEIAKAIVLGHLVADLVASPESDLVSCGYNLREPGCIFNRCGKGSSEQ
jgi:hypothetical protein